MINKIMIGLCDKCGFTSRWSLTHLVCHAVSDSVTFINLQSKTSKNNPIVLRLLFQIMNKSIAYFSSLSSSK